MSRRTVIIALAVIFLVITAIAAVGTSGSDRPMDHRTTAEMVQVVDSQGAPIEGETTVTLEKRGFTFPFCILLVLLGSLFSFGVSRFFVPGCRFSGDRQEEWLKDWHRRQHEPVDPPTATSSTVS